jgi:hypothetical protein
MFIASISRARSSELTRKAPNSQFLTVPALPAFHLARRHSLQPPPIGCADLLQLIEERPGCRLAVGAENEKAS